MSTYPTLKRAPIVEAEIRFDADASEHWDPKVVQPLLAEKWATHPHVEEFMQMRVVYDVGSSSEPTVGAPALAELRFLSPNEPTIHVAMGGGYKFIRKAPYTEWESFEHAAIEGWQVFESVLRPTWLNSVAVRFVNHLVFPLQGFRTSSTFPMHPSLPKERNWTFRGINQVIQFSPQNSAYTVEQVLATAFTAEKDSIAFELGTTVFLTESLSAVGLTLSQVLRDMRILKNDAFFGALTPEVLENYK